MKGVMYEEFRNIINMNDENDSYDNIMLFSFLKGITYKEFIAKCPKCLWLWIYITRHPKFTVEEYQELKKLVLFSEDIIPYNGSKREWDGFIIPQELKMDLLMVEYSKQEKNLNFMVMFLRHKGDAFYEELHQKLLDLTKEWVDKK